MGCVLRPGYDLPPPMFTVEEVEAIVLGARLSRDRGDADLARAADDVLAKVATVLPPPLAAALERSALLVPSRAADEAGFGPHMAVLRRGARQRARLRLGYEDASGAVTDRVVWPPALLFHSHATPLGAWCELREGYRFFRTDRIRGLEATGERFDARNAALLDELRTHECVQQA